MIAEGEVNQLTAQRRVETSEDHYLEIIAAKTAALFAAACRIAAVVAERGEAAEQALDAYGRNLGIAFQLVDDAIDYASDAATMGKGVGDDFRDGKVTLPVILAYARGSDEDRAFWRDAMAGRRASDEDLAQAIRLLRDSRRARRHDRPRAPSTASARSTRSAPSRPAGPRRRWSRRSSSRSRALINGGARAQSVGDPASTLRRISSRVSGSAGTAKTGGADLRRFDPCSAKPANSKAVPLPSKRARGPAAAAPDCPGAERS